MKRSESAYKRHRFPPEIIQHAVWLYYRFNLSSRDIEDLLAERGIAVSYESIRLWCIKFGSKYANRLRGRHQGYGDTSFSKDQVSTKAGQLHFGTQVQRERELTLMANQLHEIGYRGMNSHSLKPKHVEALVKHWLENGVATGTIKNRMSAFRWWARKVNRQNVVARSNDFYGIPNRIFVNNTNKAKSVLEADLAKVCDQHVRMSLELQQAFGLRREESIKFIPNYADQGDHLTLKASWTKGGKARTLPIRTPEQREVLDRAHRLAGKGSLIPSNRNYIQQLRIYMGHTQRAGLSKMHGLRHAYAQGRYEELTGWKSPIAGGPISKALTSAQKALDREVRLLISRELGHERRQVVSVYLGR